jgi:Deoxyribonuclease II
MREHRSLDEARWVRRSPWRNIVPLLLGLVLAHAGTEPVSGAEGPPRPLLEKNGVPVDWWFAFKFNAQKTFSGCGADTGRRICIFGGSVRAKDRFGQQFAFASSRGSALSQGQGCIGATTTDPVGATFDQVYNGNFFYVIWNDQFYGDPIASSDAPWGHSKGLLAWSETGEGFVMQVSTPSWPGSGTSHIKRKAGNTLGCISSNNNLLASQHFFALKLDKDDLVKVLRALATAAVVTDPAKLQIVRSGGPEDVQQLVGQLGKRPQKSKPGEAQENFFTREELSSGVALIAKSANLAAPPWEVVSAILDGTAERTATWWTKPKIYSTTKSSTVTCLKPFPDLYGKPGPVAIALTGEWNDQEIKLNAPSNHAKIGVSTAGGHHYVIFGDLNQQGALSPPGCESSQNGRGGLFFVLDNRELQESVAGLIDGDTASTRGKP